MPVNPARNAAFQELTRLFQSEKYANLALDALDEKYDLDARDKALFTQLYYGVIQRKITLDYLMSRFSDLAVNQIDQRVLVLLEMGLYQILYLDRVPDRAAVNESVLLAKHFQARSAGFVNAVLRRASLEKDGVSAILDLPGSKGLALREGYPRYLVSQWIEQYGKEKAREICQAQNAPAALTIRVNSLKVTRAEYGALLREAGIPFHDSILGRHGLTIERPLSPLSLPGWSEGLFFVQDGAAQFAADQVEAKPGQTVLDLCAAPGGKSFSMAMDMANQGTLIALELHPHRTDLIREGVKRLGLSCVAPETGDASLPLSAWTNKADRVLCDVPCSGSGVIAKKPDIRLKQKEESASLPALQGAILEAGSKAVRVGGRLVYATCALNKRENEEVTDAFLAKRSDFHRIAPPVTIFPVAKEHDGFFIDVLERDP